MDMPRVVSREEWLTARKELLTREKAATRARDVLNAQRRALPMVTVDKPYRFAGPALPAKHARENVSLLELFEGRRQLIVCHVMFHSERGEACSGCSYSVDNLPHLSHLRARETSLVVISRAPLEQLAAFQKRMSWTFAWYSSLGSDFNYDFHVTTDEDVAPVEYNYRDKATLERLGHVYHVKGEQPGVSVFLREGQDIFHSYSTYGRGVDLLLTTYNYLDLTPFGRGEGRDGTPDVNGAGPNWLRHHDKYTE